MVPSSRHNFDAIEAIAGRKRVHFARVGAHGGDVSGQRVPIRRLEVGIKFHPVDGVRDRQPAQLQVGSYNDRRQDEWPKRRSCKGGTRTTTEPGGLVICMVTTLDGYEKLENDPLIAPAVTTAKVLLVLGRKPLANPTASVPARVAAAPGTCSWP